jgi:hypothetical protein
MTWLKDGTWKNSCDLSPGDLDDDPPSKSEYKMDYRERGYDYDGDSDGITDGPDDD